MKRPRAATLVLLLLGSPALAAEDAGAPPRCVPASAKEVTPELERLDAALRREPGEPVLVFEQAIAHAQLCDRERTLDRLRAVAATYGGLDPGSFRGFAFLREDPEFQAIVRGIRSRNPPVLSSRPAYVLEERGLFPEGMAFDRRTGRVYSGGSRRRVVWTDRAGKLRVLVPAGAAGLGFVAGNAVDAGRDRLCVASSSSIGNGGDLPDAVTGILCFALADGTPVRTLRLPPGRTGFLNDLAIDPATGALYTTNTTTGAVFTARLGDQVLSELLPDGAVPGANGITLDPAGRSLFVAGDEGITRIDLRTRVARRLERRPPVVDGSLDGLYFHRGTLVGIQNGVHPGRVVRFVLDPGLGRILRMEVLEAYAPWMDSPTTGAIDGDTFLYLANTQLGRMLRDPDAGGGEPSPVQVRRIPLGRVATSR